MFEGGDHIIDAIMDLCFGSLFLSIGISDRVGKIYGSASVVIWILASYAKRMGVLLPVGWTYLEEAAAATGAILAFTGLFLVVRRKMREE